MSYYNNKRVSSSGATGNKGPHRKMCRYGDDCRRADCWFEHPGKKLVVKKPMKSVPKNGAIKAGMRVVRNVPRKDIWDSIPDLPDVWCEVPMVDMWGAASSYAAVAKGGW